MVDYDEIALQLKGILEGQDTWYTNLSQFAALLNFHLDDINWVGFYMATEDKQLKLGPFQGLVACVDIPFGKGVCGTAAASRESQVVSDVHAFPGHIACDARSNSEVVVPLLDGDRLLGVLDIDSPSHGRFSDTDRQGLEQLVHILVSGTNWPAHF
jgi:GAF domain-containing protein